MPTGRPRSSGIFSGIVLIAVGALLLLHNYRGLELGDVIKHWWPLALIFLGGLKLYERTMASRSGDAGSARITPGEIFLVLGMLTLLSCVVAVDLVKSKVGDWGVDLGRDRFSFDMDVAPQTVPPDARITIRGSRGDITVRSSDAAQIQVSGKKIVRGWNEDAAQKLAGPISVEIVKNGDGYEVHPTGINAGDSRIGVDMEVVVPKKAQLTVRSERGSVTVSEMATAVTVASTNGGVEVRDTNGDVSIDMRRGDAKVSDAKGNVRIAGKGGEVDVTNATGGLTLEGEFYGPIRADKVAKGVRFISQRTDLTLSQLSGHLETSSGNIEIYDAPGNLSLRTNSYNVTIENAGGKVKVSNRDGDIELRFSNPPKEDIEITNSSASISISLPSSANFEILADCHSGDIDSEFSADTLKKTTAESGDSHLEGKYGTGRGPKITLKTSYGSISIHKTS